MPQYGEKLVYPLFCLNPHIGRCIGNVLASKRSDYTAPFPSSPSGFATKFFPEVLSCNTHSNNTAIASGLACLQPGYEETLKPLGGKYMENFVKFLASNSSTPQTPTARGHDCSSPRTLTCRG